MKFICNKEKIDEIKNVINSIVKNKFTYTSEKIFEYILMDFCHLYYKNNKTDLDYDSLAISMAILMYCDFDYDEEKKKRK